MDITRSFIETAVTKALADIQRDPDRSVRNIVDLGTNFSKGRFQKRFLQSAQTMLRAENSAYYTLAKRVVAEVDHTTLRTFGINMGYNSFTWGAKTIRTKEASLLINIPWTLSFSYREGEGNLSLEEIDETLHAGKALGIYTAMLFCRGGDIEAVTRLFAAHRDCAFVLFLLPEGLTEAAIAPLQAHHNLLIALPCSDPAFAGLALALRTARCLYAAYGEYNEATAAGYLEAAWPQAMAAEGCTFALLLAQPGTPAHVVSSVYAHVVHTRENQQYPIFLMDYASDLLYIDQVISDQSCYLSVDAQGRVHGPAYGQPTAVHLRDGSLLDVLSRTMPRLDMQAQA